jgi:hypothetical protein
MTSSPSDLDAKLVALALFEIRVLLSGFLGSKADADANIRQAAHLAYALHNDAIAIVEGRHFDVEEAMSRLRAVDAMLGAAFSDRFLDLLGQNRGS